MSLRRAASKIVGQEWVAIVAVALQRGQGAATRSRAFPRDYVINYLIYFNLINN
jgi:hypothetical protein